MASGILGPEDANLPTSLGFVVQNAWVHSDGERYYGVYAGMGSGPNGALILETVDPITMGSEMKFFETEIEGPVMIASVTGMTLQVDSIDGAYSVAFDVSTEVFIS